MTFLSVFVVFAATTYSPGRSILHPCHQSGYQPVECALLSYPPAHVLPIRLPAMNARAL